MTNLSAIANMYDPEGQPMTMDDWLKNWDRLKLANRRRTYVRHKIVISTVWLGLDHGWGGRMETWETMIFIHRNRDKRLGLENVVYRYANREQAYINHERLVSRVRSGGLVALGASSPWWCP